MRNTVLHYLLLPLFATFSLSLSAAPASTVSTEPRAIVEQQKARLDLNKADATELQSTLSGIGKSKAEAIVAHRDEHGDFKSVEELLEIKGIGTALLDRNRDRITVN